MPKYCSENELVKRDYALFLQAAAGKQEATIDAAVRAIERFDTSTGRKPFSNFMSSRLGPSALVCCT